MYERFTDRARKVMQLANQEAQRFNHEYIGTEHVLLGLVKEGSGVAANVLKNLDIDLRKLRAEVEVVVQRRPAQAAEPFGRTPQTPRAKKALEFAVEEARTLGHNYVGTEHLLLGLLREQEGVAAQVLTNLGVRLDRIRAEVLRMLGLGGLPNRVATPPDPSVVPPGLIPTPPVDPPPGGRRKESKVVILDRHIGWLQRLMEAAVADRDMALAAEVLAQLTDVRGVRDRLAK